MGLCYTIRTSIAASFGDGDSPMRRILCSILLIPALAACDRGDSKPPRAITTTTVRIETPSTLPATAPATRPTSSVLVIDGKEYKFPAARLHLVQQQPQVELLLFSDDPAEALKPHYDGNRYYFAIKLDIDNLTHLAHTDYRAKALSMERTDSPYGIFLDGDRYLLQPYEWRVEFVDNGAGFNIGLQGQFIRFDLRDDGPIGKMVQVFGVLPVELEGKTLKPASK